MTELSPTPPSAKADIRTSFLGLTERHFAFVLLAISPFFFASNMLMARATHDLVPPVALAFWRWAVTFMILSPLAARILWHQRAAIRREWPDFLVLGALGMGVCGAFVYIGADTTTATNIGLIYAASPILIVLLGRIVYGESLGPIQALGIALSLAGVIAIICRGELHILLGLRFTVGDIWIFAAMAGWAVYSVMLRHRRSQLPMIARFVAITGGGVLVLLPFHLAEIAAGETVVWNLTTIGIILFLALIPACAAYLSYARIQQVLGAGPASLLMYLVPLYNSILAYLLLGEDLEAYHLLGAALVLPGLYLATRGAGRPA